LTFKIPKIIKEIIANSFYKVDVEIFMTVGAFYYDLDKIA